MALRKPSDFFEDKNKNGVGKSIKDTESFDTFQSYKENLEKYDTISKFSGSLEEYNENVERVNYISQQLLGVQEEIKTLLTREDLDRALMSQLLVVEESAKDIQSRVRTINNEKLADIKDQVENLTEQVDQFISIDAPKYKNFIFDSENRAYTRYEKFEGRISESIETVQQSIDDINSGVDQKHEEINESISEFKDEIANRVSSVKKSVSKFIDEERVSNSQNEIQVRKDLEKFEGKLDEISVDVFESSADISEIKKELTNKVDKLEVDLIRKESIVKIQNESLSKVQSDVRDAIKKLNINELEKKNASLAKKVDYIQEVLEKFSEKEVLTESITEPPSTNNSDPLTPTDQKFVTFDQLQNHYRLFLNRIQQQLSSLGGGGETRLEFLDDVDRDTAKVDKKFLRYDASIGKWIGADSGVTTTTSILTNGVNDLGIITTTKLHVDPVGSGFTYSEDLVVQGNARVTGILSIGTSSIVLDSEAKQIRGIEQLHIASREFNQKPIIIRQVEEKIVFRKTEFDEDGKERELEEEASVGIGSTASINTSGIITAAQFVGDIRGNVTGRADAASALTGNPDIFVKDITASGNVNIAGTLTYEDVTNIDSVGLITARSGINATGVVTATSFVKSSNSGGFLKADGTEDTSTYLTSYTETQTLGDVIALGNVTSQGMSVGVVTASSFDGPLTGIATGATRVYVDESEDDNTDYNIIFTDKDPGQGNSHHTMQVDNTGLTFNPGTNTLSVANIESTAGNGVLDINDELRVTDTLRVRADNKEFIVENGSGNNKFSVDTDNGNTHVYGTLDVDGDVTLTASSGGSKILADTFSVKNAADNVTKMFFGNANTGHAVRLYNNGSEKLTTTSDGIFVQNDIKASGVVSATSYEGSGTNLTGIVTSLVAGANISLSSSDGRVTVTGLAKTDNIVADSLVVSGFSTFNAGIFAIDQYLGFGNPGSFGHGELRIRKRTNTQGIIQNQTGDFIIDNQADSNSNYIRLQGRNTAIEGRYGNETIAKFSDGGSVELNYDGSKKFETTGVGATVFGTTQTQQLNVSGVSTFQSNVHLGDSVEARFGADDDFKVYYSGSNALIVNETGGLYLLNTADDQDIVLMSDNGAGGTTNYALADGSTGEFILYHYGDQRLATKSTGIDVTGTINGHAIPSGSGTFALTSDVPTNNNQLTNGAGYITTSFTNTNQLTNGAGFVTFTNNNQLTNGAGYITTSFTNTNQLTNGAGFITGVSTFSGDYNDLTNTPTIPTNNNQLTNGAGYITTSFTNTSQLTNDAGFITGVSTFSGDFNDLTNKPSGVSTFSGDYNDLTNTPTIPTNNNQLTNGAGYITTSFTNTNQLTNGAGFITNSVTGDFEVNGNVTIGGTLTYEDVTNIDSVGLVTARKGIVVSTGGINVTGVSTFNNSVNLGDSNVLYIGDDNDLAIYETSGDVGIVQQTAGKTLFIRGDNVKIDKNGSKRILTHSAGAVDLYYNDSKKLETTDDGVDVTGHTETDTLKVSGVSTFQGNVDFGDNVKLRLGDSQDLEIYHNGSTNVFQDNGPGGLYFKANDHVFVGTNNNILADFNQGADVILYYNAQRKFVTTGYGASILGTTETQQLNVTGVSTFTGNIQLPDNTVLRIGEQGDLRLYHTGSENIIWDNYGVTKLLGGQWDFKNLADNQTAAHFDYDAGQELYYNGTKTFETTASGIDVTGHTETDTLRVSGISTFEDNAYFEDEVTINRSTTNTALSIKFGNTLKGRLTPEGSAFKVSANASNDLRLICNDSGGTNGDVQIASGGGGIGKMALFTGSGTAELYYQDSKKFETTNTGIDVTGTTDTDQLNVSGVSTFQNNVHLLDGDILQIGGSVGTVDGLEIYHNNVNSVIKDSGTGSLFILSNNLRIQSPTGNKDIAKFIEDGAVELYYNEVKRFETISTGATVTGDMYATRFHGDGSNLTGINTFSGDYNDLTNKPAGGGGSSKINELDDGYTLGLSVGLGTFALSNDDGTDNKNVAIGYSALTSTTSGASNVAIGYNALEEQANINNTTAVGEGAGEKLRGNRNVAIGKGAARAGGSNDSHDNIGIGYHALFNLSGGDNNTVLGASAGNSITTGSNNICIGKEANVSSSNASNEATIGNASINKLRVPGIGLTFAANGPNLIDGYVLTYNAPSGEVQLAGVSTFSGNYNDLTNTPSTGITTATAMALAIALG